jgi:hypothetical protein
MSRFFQNIDPLRPASVTSPRNKGGEGGGGSIIWKTRDIGLVSYSNNLSTRRGNPIRTIPIRENTI